MGSVLFWKIRGGVAIWKLGLFYFEKSEVGFSNYNRVWFHFENLDLVLMWKTQQGQFHPEIWAMSRLGLISCSLTELMTPNNHWSIGDSLQQRPAPSVTHSVKASSPSHWSLSTSSKAPGALMGPVGLVPVDEQALPPPPPLIRGETGRDGRMFSRLTFTFLTVCVCECVTKVKV